MNFALLLLFLDYKLLNFTAMKKILTLLFIVITTVSVASAGNKIYYNDSPLPAASKTLLSKHFKAKVNFVKVETNVWGSVKEYEAVLTDGTEVDFDANGSLKSVDAGANGVPNSLVLPAIATYVKNNCKNQKIMELDITSKTYKIELQDGRDLIFDRNGKFLREER